MLLVGGGVAALVGLTPLVYLVIRATEGGLGPLRETVLRARTAELVWNTVELAVAVTVSCVVIGVAAAWLVTSTDLPGRRVWRVVLGLPLAVPTYLAGYAWLNVRPTISGTAGAWMILTLCSYPYVYLPVVAALQRADPAQVEMARSLGRGPVASFLTVTLRQTRVAAASGALLVALYVMSDFGAVSIMRVDVLARGIYNSYRASFDRTPAAILGCVLVVMTMAVVVAESLTRGRGRSARVGAGSTRRGQPQRLGWVAVPALAASAALVVLAIGVPVWSLFSALSTGRSAGIDWDRVGQATSTTLGWAAAAALLTVALAVPVGVLAARFPGRATRALSGATYLGHALPGIVVALSLVFLGVRVFTPFYQRLPLLLLAYAALFLPLAVGSVEDAVARTPASLEDAARSLGHRSWVVWWRVTIPLALPGLAAACAMVALATMKELPATLILAPTGSRTLATELWTQTGVRAFAAAAPYAAALLVVAIVPSALLSLGRRERG